MTTLTLISSVLNGMPYLDEMLASAGHDPRVEHLAIDAGSSDGSIELLRGRDLKLLERPAIPLYTAWNEAVRLAESPWVAFLNSDDLLPPAALPAMLDAIAGAGDGEVICGEAEVFTGSSGAPESLMRLTGESLAGLGLPVLAFGAPIINAKLFRRDLILDAGGFDEPLAFSADREFLLRLVLQRRGLKTRRLPAVIYRYRSHAGSKTLQQTAARRLEIAREHHRIALRFAELPGIDRGARRMLRAWAAHENAVTVALGPGAGRDGGYRAAGGALGRLLRHAPSTGLDLARAYATRRRCRQELRARNGGGMPSAEAGQ